MLVATAVSNLNKNGVGYRPRRDPKLDEKNKRRQRQNHEDSSDEAGPGAGNYGMGRTAGFHGWLLDKRQPEVLTPDYIP